MPRPSSSKEGGGSSIFGVIRPGSRRSSKVPSEDGHSVAAGAAGGPNVLRSPSLSAQSAGDSHHHHHRALDRHTRMKLAMAEAQADIMGGAPATNGNAAGAAASANGHPAAADHLHEESRISSGAVSPRTNIAAGQAQAQAAAAVAAAQRMAATSPQQHAQTSTSSPHRNVTGLPPMDKPGEGSLTFEAFGSASGGDVVLADGVTPPSAGPHNTIATVDPTVNAAADAGIIPSVVTDSPTAVRQSSLPPEDQPAVPPQHAKYATTTAASALPSSLQHSANNRAASLAVQGEGGAHARSRTDHQHTMAQSASTSALTPGPFGRLRKLSDASSNGGGLSVDGRASEAASSRQPSPAKQQQSRKSSKGASGGIAAALAASGAGMAGLGAANPTALHEAHAKAAAAAAAAAAASPQTRKSSHGQKVEKDFVGGSQGGVYRDPRSGLLVEKNEAGEEKLVNARTQMQLDPDRTNSAPPPAGDGMLAPDALNRLRRQPSEISLAESDASSASGLAAAASFPAAMQAGSLLTPALTHTANAPGAPTIALNASNAEHHYPSPRASLEDKDAPGGADAVAELDAVRRHSADLPDSASTAGGAGSGAGAGWADMGAQITGFAVASSKRNADFHALFPTVPDDDYLIEGGFTHREQTVTGTRR